MPLPGRVLPVAAIGVRIARPQVLTICIRVELRAITGVFDDLLRQCGSYGSCRDNSGGANQCVFHLGLLVGFPRAQDGTSHRFRQSTLLGRSKIEFNGAGGRQPYIEFMSDRFGPLTIAAGIRACRSSRFQKIKPNLEDQRVTSRQCSIVQHDVSSRSLGSEINED